MAEVAEVVNDVQPAEKETVEKKAVEERKGKEGKENDVEDGKTEKKEKDSNPKENGRAETNEKEAETNGSTETTEVTATKRKSGAGDAPDGTPAEGATPEKKIKISNEDKEKDSTNGESEVASEGAAVTPNSVTGFLPSIQSPAAELYPNISITIKEDCKNPATIANSTPKLQITEVLHKNFSKIRDLL